MDLAPAPQPAHGWLDAGNSDIIANEAIYRDCSCLPFADCLGAIGPLPFGMGGYDSGGTDPSLDERDRLYHRGGACRNALAGIAPVSARVNIVVVQKIAGDVEEGKYIYIPVSSYLPQPGDDGFEFKPNPKIGETYILGNGIFDYTRTRGK
jgi:hypothetical protein